MNSRIPGNLKLSLIIPVYNRPDEIEELLESLSHQTHKDFEVIIVEDGSVRKCDQQVENYSSLLNISYFYKSNSGPGLTRNFGIEKSAGNYFIFLDSDCVIPAHYVQTVHSRLTNDFIDAFGGPDNAHESFTNLQKAINYSMTSFLTTGGIRGGGEKLDKFYPRSFNMGYSKEVYEKTGGFSGMRFGEDIDMSIRILNAGFKTALIREAFVYHKRRTSIRQFFKQVFNSGIARINLYKKHPGTLKAVHFFPSLFVIGILLLSVLSIIISPYFIAPVVFFKLLIFIDSSVRNSNLYIGLISIITSLIQISGYGSGFIIAFWKRIVLSKSEFAAFPNSFYK